MYAIVPAINGIPQTGPRHIYFGMEISQSKAVVYVEDGPLEEDWEEITEEEFRQYVREPTDPEPAPETVDDKLARLEQQNLILMDALATTFEELLELKEMLNND